MNKTDFSGQSFTYGGRKYGISFTLYVNSSEAEYETISLNNQDVAAFEYVNEANQLYLTGSITYIDKTGIIDKLFSKTFPYCEVTFGEYLQEQVDENDLITDKLDPELTLSHIFYITGIQILKRVEHSITYKLNIVSINWFDLIGNINFTNYGKNPESIIHLLKTALSYNDLQIDEETFDLVKSDIKLNYITNGNDNSISMVNYLLSKMYYYDKKEPSLKFIYYNDLKNKYCIFDIKNDATSTGTHSHLISMFKTQGETLTQPDKLDFASVIRFPKTSYFQHITSYKISDYDLLHNKIVPSTLQSKSIIDFQNQHYEVGDVIPKYVQIFDSKRTYKQHSTYWNNNNLMNCYENITREMFEDNSLVVSSAGVISKKPGDIVQISVERPTAEMGEVLEDQEEYEKKFRAYEGPWFVSKVRHIVMPMIQRYSQNTVLFRNFARNDIPKLYT